MNDVEGGHPPHVILAVVDDLPWEMWPRPGNEAARSLLPNLTHHLVDNGLTLERHYAFPLCAPARASLLSGRFPHRAYETIDMRACKGVSPGMSMLSEKLKEGAGYITRARKTNT